MEKKNPAEGGASKPGLGHAGAGGRRYVTAVGRGGLESGAGTQPIGEASGVTARSVWLRQGASGRRRQPKDAALAGARARSSPA